MRGTESTRRERNTSPEALKNTFNLAGGSVSKLDDRSIEIQNLKGKKRVEENEQSFGEMADTVKYANGALPEDSRMRREKASKKGV